MIPYDRSYINNRPILLVEDNPDEIMLITRALKKSCENIQLYTVMDGAQAIEFLSHLEMHLQNDPATTSLIILLDLKLPKKSGFEVLRWIRSRNEIKRLPVIIFTSSNQESDVKKAYDYNANSYIVKPVSFGELVYIADMNLKYWFDVSLLPSVMVNKINEQ